MIVRCFKCGKEVFVDDKYQGKIMEIVKHSKMIPFSKNPYQATFDGWECRKHFREEQRDIPPAFAEVLNKKFWKLV